MREIEASDAKRKWADLLDRVETGEEVVITRGGRLAARLVAPEGEFDKERARRAADRISKRGKATSLRLK